MALPRAWMCVALTALLTMSAASAQAKVGDLWVTDTQDECSAGDTGTVYSVDPSTHAITQLSTGGFLRRPSGIATSPDGNTVWVVDRDAFDPAPPASGCNAGPGGVIAVDTNTGQQSVVSGDGTPAATWTDPNSIAYDTSTGTLVVADGGSIWRVDPNTGVQSLVAQGDGLSAPKGLAVTPTGTIYVADPDAHLSEGEIFKIVPQPSPPPWPPAAVAYNNGVVDSFGDPKALTIRPDGKLVVADSNIDNYKSGGVPHKGFILVDPTTNGATEMGPTPSNGPSFCGPSLIETPFLDVPGVASLPGGEVFATDPTGPETQWCAEAPHHGVVYSVSSAAAAGWAAGLDSNSTWQSPTGIAAAVNRVPVAAIGVPTDGGTVGTPVTIDGSHSVDPDGDALSYHFDLDGNGTFETPGDANAKATALFTTPGDYPVGVQVNDGNGGVSSTGTTLHVAAAQSLPVDPPADPPAQTPPPPATQTPAAVDEKTTPKTPATVTFQQLLSPNGVIVPLTCTADCTVDAILQILLKDYKNLTAANKLITIGTGRIVLTAGKNGKLRIKLTKEARKKLKIALAAAHISVKRKIKLNLVLQSKYKSGKKKTIRRKIILKG